MMLRPLRERAPIPAADTAAWRSPWATRYASSGSSDRATFAITALQPVSNAVYNSAFPYGMNDGSMWAGRGMNLGMILGARARAGPVTIDLIPELAWSQNKDFALAPLSLPAVNASLYADQFKSRTIDRPQRHGDDALASVSLGQSAVTLAAKGALVGVATRNMWWGPGIDNSLLMTNNAPGFRHAFLGTDRPVSIGIGRLEALWVIGRLRQSDYWRTSADTFATKRWLNAMSLVFEPRGAPGMYFGATRLFYVYDRYNPLGLSEIAQIFQPFEKRVFVDSTNPFANDDRDQMLSLSFRWVFPESGFETYGEWGRNDHNWDRRDIVFQPDHSRAWIIGAAKVFNVRDGALLFRAEASDLMYTHTILGRATPAWYAHHRIQQGYTNEGQVVGAGIGPGANHQRISAEYIERRCRVGLVLRRHRGDQDGFYSAGFRDPFLNNASLFAGPVLTFFTGPLRIDAAYEMQYEFNRYSLRRPNGDANDHRNHRLQLRGEIVFPTASQYRPNLSNRGTDIPERE